MHVAKKYSLKEFLAWTRRDIYLLIVLAAIPTILYEVFDLKWIALPWVVVALVGTAAAFIVGFKNTQTYNRLWEARMIWGAITNGSRTWGIMARDLVKHDHHASGQLFYRHFAWLTALRYQLRKPQGWENQQDASFKEYKSFYSVPEWETELADELGKYLSAEELEYVLSKKNRATQLISLQSRQLRALKDAGQLGEYEFVALEARLADFYDQQGKCERIKNFPYPSQFSSIANYFVWLLAIVLPFGLVDEFSRLGDDLAWLNIPFSVILTWLFTSMDKVGEATQNPFEGGANDIPMAQMSRGIEIDLREMLDETQIPEGVAAVNNILM